MHGGTSSLLFLSIFALGCAGARSHGLGVADRKLAPCPHSPHCVSTQSEGASRRIEALSFMASKDETRSRLLEIVRSMPRATVVTESPDYLHVEFTSPVWRFVDDLEIYLDEQTRLIHLRSASRLGYYDLGVNRRRIEKIRRKFLEPRKGAG